MNFFRIKNSLSVVSLATALLASTAGCGSRSNLLYQTVPDEHKQSFEYLIDQGQIAYDKGDLNNALHYSKSAYQMAPDSESAAILFGFVNLALAGFDPFKIVRLLIEKKNTSDQSAGADTASAEGANKNSAGLVMAQLRTVLRLDESEIQAILVRDDTDPLNPLSLPICVEQARDILSRLKYINAAVTAGCQFVDTEARVTDDYRQICHQFLGVRVKLNQAHLLWAFSHLAEAIVFYSAQFGDNNQLKNSLSFLEKKVDEVIQQSVATPEELRKFSESIAIIQALYEKIMPVSGRCSNTSPTTQLQAMLYDLFAVESAFSRMIGISDSIVGTLKNAIKPIKNLNKEIGSLAVKTQQLEALRRDLTNKITEKLSIKVNDVLQNSSSLSVDEKSNLCTNASGIVSEDLLKKSCAQIR